MRNYKIIYLTGGITGRNGVIKSTTSYSNSHVVKKSKWMNNDKLLGYRFIIPRDARMEGS